MRDLLQIAFAPKDAGEWARRLSTPTGPEEIEAALEPYRPALILDDPEHPAMQVRPNVAALPTPSSSSPSSSGTSVFRARLAGFSATACSAPVAWLLPDAPTKNVIDKDDDFFTKRDPVVAIGAGAILPVLYAHMVLFPPERGRLFRPAARR